MSIGTPTLSFGGVVPARSLFVVSTGSVVATMRPLFFRRNSFFLENLNAMCSINLFRVSERVVLRANASNNTWVGSVVDSSEWVCFFVRWIVVIPLVGPPYSFLWRPIGAHQQMHSVGPHWFLLIRLNWLPHINRFAMNPAVLPGYTYRCCSVHLQYYSSVYRSVQHGRLRVILNCVYLYDYRSL